MEPLTIPHVAVNALLRLSLLVSVSAVALVILLVIAVRRRFDIHSMRDVAGRLEPVDLAAFHLLTDASENEYLAECLPPHAYRQVHRLRILAALAYLTTARSNAMLLLRYAHAACLSDNCSVSEIATELFSSAMRFQILCLSVRLWLYLAYIFPLATLRLTGVVDAYAHLKSIWFRIGGLQNPGASASITASV
jgi:hypothetical protein